MANNKSTYLPYVPGNPPTVQTAADAIRAVWDELYKVAQSLVDLDRPASISLLSNEQLLAAQTPGPWTRLFNGGEVAQWEQPAGTFNHSTGVYTIAQEGLYQLYVRLNVPPFPSPQTKDYQAQIQYTINYAQPGKPDTIGIIEDGGLDSHYLTTQGQVVLPLYQGDQATFDARLIRASGAGTVDCTATFQSFRISGVK